MARRHGKRAADGTNKPRLHGVCSRHRREHSKADVGGIVIDYDGEIIEQVNKLSGETHTLPAGPTNHPKLVFQEWASCDTITNNTVTVTDHDILVGAVYTTASGTNEFDIKLNEESGKTVKFNMTGTKNWGDGTSDTLNTHTYADYGEYTITCDGTTLNQTYLMGQNPGNFYTSDFKLKVKGELI